MRILAQRAVPDAVGFATDCEAASRCVRLAAKKACAVKVVVSAQTTPGETVEVLLLAKAKAVYYWMQPTT